MHLSRSAVRGHAVPASLCRGCRTSAMACSVGMTSWMSVTPESELVVAPAGYSLKATIPAAFARLTYTQQ